MTLKNLRINTSMKVSDILRENLSSFKRIPIVTVKQPPNINKKANQSNNTERLGRGMQGAAYEFKTRPNAIVKTATLRNLEDPYLQYISTIMQHQDNPFFPRIFNAKILEYTPSRWDKQMLDPKKPEYQKEILRQPQYTLLVNMEKLRPMSGQLKDSAAAMLNRLGIDKDDMNPESWGAERAGSDDYSTDTWDKHLRSAFDSKAMRNELANNTKNPQFKEALNIMEPMWNTYGADMKDDNFMIRLTPHGPQPVFVDPIYPDL